MSLATRFAAVARHNVARHHRTMLCRPLATISMGSATPVPPAAAAEATDASSAVKRHHIVMSVAGEDRAGIVHSVSNAVANAEGNVEQSKMAVLGGDFAMIVHVSLGSSTAADSLASSLRESLPSFSITVRETTAPSDSSANQSLWTLSLEGPDNAGIVSAISQALATNGCNVHDMETETTTAPFAGYDLFKVKGIVTIDESKLEPLSTALNKVEDRFGSTISLVQHPQK